MNTEYCRKGLIIITIAIGSTTVISAMPPERDKSSELNEQASKLKDQGELERALLLYNQAAELDNSWSAPWYNMGLLYKNKHNWLEAFRCNQEAVQRDPSNEAAW